MAQKPSPKKMPAIAEPKTKPVRVDLAPMVHKALRMKAASQETSMASLARRIISEHLGFKDEAGGANKSG
jgi:hypothetical protein